MAVVSRRFDAGTIPNMEYEGKLFDTEYNCQKGAQWLELRNQRFNEIAERYAKTLMDKPRKPITITFPDGKTVQGTAWETTPLDVARTVSNALAKATCVARVAYDEEVEVERASAADNDSDDEVGCCSGGGSDWQLWDAGRALIGSCRIEFKKFEDEEGRKVFWHSSSHVLGQALEMEISAHLTIGPALDRGFYYDCYMGKEVMKPELYGALESCAKQIAQENQPFERVLMSKEEALLIFADNPFKVQLIKNKVPDGADTTVYRCGSLVDLCMGPHLPSTQMVRAFSIEKNSTAYWLGKAANDTLHRIYAIAFPDQRQLNVHKKFMLEAKERDHRNVGNQMNLFFFHNEFSPGSAFWMPEGARIYNKLIDFMRREYRIRGFSEVISPNLYNAELFKTSGHYKNYKDDMFMFQCEGKEWGMKPMNCPGHCVMFNHRVMSYKDLPWRIADFGVLHRNESSGALSGLTRVRRFQQDDAHIYCRRSQILEEVSAALDFLNYVYEEFGFEFDCALSTRPKKAMGEISLWNEAEEQLEVALNAFGKPWKINAGDGAFYGPKIDIRLKDCLGRYHQCGTVQLDFQMPLSFGLTFRTEDYGKGEGGTETPVMIHRAVLGSLERFTAIMMEHFGPRLPFWISPRQIKVLPISEKNLDYSRHIYKQFHSAGFDVKLDLSDETINKKIRTAQNEQFNYMFIVGAEETEAGTVMVRPREKDAVQEAYDVEKIYLKLMNELAPSSKPTAFAKFKKEERREGGNSK